MVDVTDRSRGLRLDVWRERLGVLFPVDGRAPAPWRTRAWAVLAILVGTAVSLGRTGGTGPFNSIWAEDGQYLLSDALATSPLDAIFTQANGYFVIVPRLLTEVAALFPLTWMPAVMTIEAALVTAAMAMFVFVASGAFFTGRGSLLPRLIAALPVLASPVGDSYAATAANNLATLQFAALYTALWALLWVPGTRNGRVAGAAVVIGTAFSTILALLLLPAALLRLFVRRDRFGVVLLGGLGAGIVLQLSLVLSGHAFRPRLNGPNFDPLWAGRNTLTWGLRNMLFGYAGTRNVAVPALGNVGALALATLLLAAAVVVAARRITRPSWLLAALFVVHIPVLVMSGLMIIGQLEARYLIAPQFMLFAALAALLAPSDARTGWSARAPIIALALLVAVVGVLSYRLPTSRADSTPWDRVVARGRSVCADSAVPAVFLFPNRRGDVEPAPAVKPPPAELPGGFGIWLPCSTLR